MNGWALRWSGNFTTAAISSNAGMTYIMGEDTSNEMRYEVMSDEVLNRVVFIGSHDELVTFLIEILDLDDDVDSEEKLLENTSYRILYFLLEQISAFTVAIENG